MSYQGSLGLKRFQLASQKAGILTLGHGCSVKHVSVVQGNRALAFSFLL